MGIAAPENETEREVARIVGEAYDSAWDNAIDAAAEVILRFPDPGRREIAAAVLVLKDHPE